MNRNYLLLLIPFLFVIGLGLIFLAGIIGKKEGLPSQLIGKQAPSIELESLAGMELPLRDDLLKPEVKMVNFWASWCVPCRAEHPNLEVLNSMGIPIYGINYKDNEANALAFIEELGNPFKKIGRDPKGRLGIDWGVYGIPETFIIDKNGAVVYRLAGPITQRTMTNEIIPAINSLSIDN
ncbi:MAG: DsbE family thiol:disulfide interchange protein [Rhodobacteraceae bacterium]|nr:DsbE family thiol:disulfide interchange protein [Paracoccaceae bacterium]